MLRVYFDSSFELFALMCISYIIEIVNFTAVELHCMLMLLNLSPAQKVTQKCFVKCVHAPSTELDSREKVITISLFM